MVGVLRNLGGASALPATRRTGARSTVERFPVSSLVPPVAAGLLAGRRLSTAAEACLACLGVRRLTEARHAAMASSHIGAVSRAMRVIRTRNFSFARDAS